MVRITTARSVHIKKGRVAVVHAKQDAGWMVADWLVAHAEEYQISEVRYAGYDWTAADGAKGWQRDHGTNAPARGSIVAG